MLKDLQTLQEEREYVKGVVSEERPLCWWCDHRPRKKTDFHLCGNGLDWQDVTAMERAACPGFALDEARAPDLNRSRDRKLPRAEQLTIDFGEGHEETKK